MLSELLWNKLSLIPFKVAFVLTMVSSFFRATTPRHEDSKRLLVHLSLSFPLSCSAFAFLTNYPFYSDSRLEIPPTNVLPGFLSSPRYLAL